MRRIQFQRPRYRVDGQLVPVRALVMMASIVPAAIGIEGALLASGTGGRWGTFALLALLGSALALAPVVTIERQAYVILVVALGAGILLLPPQQAFLLVIAPNIVDSRRRVVSPMALAYAIAVFGLLAIAGSELLHLPAVAGAVRRDSIVALGLVASVALGYALACDLLFDFVSTLRVNVKRLAVSVSIDFALTVMGLVAARMWIAGLHWFIPLALLPLAFIYQAQRLPLLKQEASLDPKTGLLNIRAFNSVGCLAIRRAAQSAAPVSLLAVDLDHLREINNRYGHLAGDAVIVGVSDAIKGAIRGSDAAGRFGGEEYLVLLPAVDRRTAAEVAERIRGVVAGMIFRSHGNQGSFRATVSIGVATLARHDGGQEDERLESLVSEADRLLYEAKQQGRNLVIAEGNDSSPLGRPSVPEPERRVSGREAN